MKLHFRTHAYVYMHMEDVWVGSIEIQLLHLSRSHFVHYFFITLYIRIIQRIFF